MSKIKHVGTCSHRLTSAADNPREVAFANRWQHENDLSHTLEYLLSDVPNKRGVLSERDIKVAATVIQWLGSNCGMDFIRQTINSSPEIQRWFRAL